MFHLLDLAIPEQFLILDLIIITKVSDGKNGLIRDRRSRDGEFKKFCGIVRFKPGEPKAIIFNIFDQLGFFTISIPNEVVD